MANGANLTVEQFTESVAKQIASELKLDGTDLINRLVGSLSKGLIDKIAQKQITSPITQQLEKQQQEADKSSEELKQLNKTTTDTNASIKTDLPKLIEGINLVGQKMQDSLQSLSKDFTGAIGKTNSIFKSFTDKLIDVSGSQQKEDKFPHLIKRQFVSLEKHLTELFKTKQSSSEISANIEQISLKDLLKDLPEQLKTELVTKFEGVSLKDLPEQLKTEALSKIEGVSLKDLPEQLKTELVTKFEGVSLKDLFQTFPEDLKAIFVQNIEGVSFKTLFKDFPEHIQNKLLTQIEGVSLTNLLKTLPEDLKIEIASKIQTTSLENFPEQLKTEIVAKFQDISFVNFNEELRRAIVEKIKGVSFEKLPKEVAKEIKTVFENSSTQREQTKQFQDLGKNQNEHLKKTVETLRDILGSSEELVKLQGKEKSEPERFWDNFKKLPETIESKIGEKLKGAAFSILPKSVTSFVSKFVEGKPQEKDSKSDIKELKEAFKQSQKTKEQPKSALETTEQVQKVEIDSISGMASGQLLDILPTAIKEGISSVDEKIGKILEFLEKTLLTEIKNKAGGDSSGGIMSVIETLLYAKLLSRFKPLLGGLGRGIQNLGKGGFNLARGALGGLGTLATTPIASMGAAGAAGTVAAGVVGGELIGGMAGQAIGSNEAVSEALYGSLTAGKEAYEKYGTGMIGFSRASYDYLFGEGAKVRKETAETEAKTTEMQKTLEESQIAISEYFKSKGFKNLQEFGAAVKAGETEPVKWNKETKKLDILPLKTNQTAATVTSKPFEPEKSQTFTPLQPTEKLPAVDTEKAPAVKPTDVSKETPKIVPQSAATTDKQMELNNNFLSHIDSNTSSTNQNIANLVIGFNNLASALKSNGINVPTTPPVVVNTPPPAPQQEPSTVIAKQSTSSIPDYRGFAMQAQPRAI